MSIMGDKIHRIRDFRGMTQKQLGMAVGFDEKSADVRIAQYESGTRTPKHGRRTFPPFSRWKHQA